MFCGSVFMPCALPILFMLLYRILKRCTLIMKCKQSNAWPRGGEWHLVKFVSIALNDQSERGFTNSSMLRKDKKTNNVLVLSKPFWSEESQILSDVCGLCFARCKELGFWASLASWVAGLDRGMLHPRQSKSKQDPGWPGEARLTETSKGWVSWRTVCWGWKHGGYACLACVLREHA